MSEEGELEFDRPYGAYRVVFDAGPGHRIEIRGRDIVR